MADLDPATALRRIAFLLERQRADTYRVRASAGRPKRWPSRNQIGCARYTRRGG